ncbi:conjugative relaxase domain-containing protein, TrwC/TraI family [Micromonospora nigra]|uniref:Conjugative relaxase domain-containing protein, TrwC/TraI family n=2 Tax=Micromonospora nigra TaxID=145857 RepID=A0A1C6R717_9ACTN|nr:conjugative relaxase domain-containing protein, TrwC/TraI family [Micromonospora nigra]
MTMTISSGHSVEYLTGAVAGGRENYYTGAVTDGEPPGRWSGAGAAALGLSGEVDPQLMEAVYAHFVDPRDARVTNPDAWAVAEKLGAGARKYATPEERLAQMLADEPDATPERVAQLRLQAQKSTRSAVAFHDVTFSVQKSVTVLHTSFEAQEVAAHRAGDEEAAEAWAEHRRAVEEAMWAGNRAGLDYLADAAGYARIGHHGGGAGQFTDAHDWTVASFFQHTSRDNDPQLHIHNAVLNRVQCADGKWRTLDSRAMHKHRGAAATIAERTMEEHLTRTLGVRFATRPDGKAREVVGVDQAVMDMFSTRRRQITKATQRLVAEFREKYGHEPNALQLDRLQRSATFATRKAKSHEGETNEERLDRWDAQLRAEVADGLAGVARDVLGHATGTAPADAFSPVAVIQEAMAEVQATKAAWTRADLIRAIGRALPDSLGGLDAGQVRRVVETLADAALDAPAPESGKPDGVPGGATTRHGAVSVSYDVDARVPQDLRLDNGASAYVPPGARLFATVGHIAAERALRDSTVTRGRASVPGARARQWLARWAEETGAGLGVDQAAAVEGVLTSGAAVEVLIGPAGTGKSFTVGALAAAWTDPDLWAGKPRRVVGLAASQIATEVLAGEGLDARNITRWLGAQRRLADPQAHASAEDEGWRLHAGDLVVVDEASMTDTAAVEEIRRYVDAAGGKLLLTGDHRQLAAVGAGGGLDMVTGRAATYELAEVRRFRAQWERAASLRLREGDPDAVLEYERHGRVRDGGTVEQATDAAAQAWLGDTLRGKHSLLLVDTNEQAAQASAALRAQLVGLGLVEEDGVWLDRQGTRAGVGDLIQARKIARQLAGYEGNRRGPINREYARVMETRADGSMVVQVVTGRVDGVEQYGDRLTLPASYVRDHVTLGYASTVHSAQGVTVDTTHSVVTSGTSHAALYVDATRGREDNTMYVVTVAVPADSPTGAAQDAERVRPAAVLADIVEGSEPDRAALVEAEESARAAQSMRLIGARLADAGEKLASARHAALFDRLADDGLLTAEQREALAGDDAAPALSRLIHAAEVAGHDVDQEVTATLAGRPLDGARSVAQVLHARLNEQWAGQLAPTGDTFAERVPEIGGEWGRYVDRLAELADDRRRQLGAETVEQAPQWAVETLGPIPDDVVARQEWEHRAGIVAAHRELTDWTDDAQPLGPAPKAGLVEQRASWHAAWRALGRPEADREEAEMSDGQLRVRARAYAREEQWAPAWVGDELAATSAAAARHRQEAAVLAARAAAAGDPMTAETLEREAAERAELAETLAEQQQRLEAADAARGEWYAHTAATRAAAERARAEMTARGVDLDDPDDLVTAEEWLAAQAEAQRAEDPTREVREEHDLADERAARDADDAAAWPSTTARDADTPEQTAPEQEPAAIEQVEPDQPMPDGVPSMAETAAAVMRAQAALHEIQQRDEQERQHRAAEEARRAELAQWREQDTAREAEQDRGYDRSR